METSCVKGEHSSVHNTSSAGMAACLIPLRFSYTVFMHKSPKRGVSCVWHKLANSWPRLPMVTGDSKHLR